jgi:hypothetical protein
MRRAEVWLAEHPPPGPFRKEFWRIPLRGPWLTSVFGPVLLLRITPSTPSPTSAHNAGGTATGHRPQSNGRRGSTTCVPVGLSGLLLLVWFPLILRRSEGQYKALAGLGPSPYLGRWLLVIGVLFAGSALVYALRLRRDKSLHRPHTRAGQRPDA